MSVLKASSRHFSRAWRRKLHILECSRNKIMIKLPVKLWCRFPIRNSIYTDSELWHVLLTDLLKQWNCVYFLDM